jgi:hypothetical protein
MRERRLAKRKKVAGQKGLSCTAAPCEINDVSATGASLTFDYARVLPTKFKLRFLEDDHEETAQVIWRRGAVVGVSFYARSNLGRHPRVQRRTRRER